MTKSKKKASNLDLEFPTSSPGFTSEDFDVSLDAIIELSEEKLPLQNADESFWEERKKKFQNFVPFTLDD